jgi:hypothetical protein
MRIVIFLDDIFIKEFCNSLIKVFFQILVRQSYLKENWRLKNEKRMYFAEGIKKGDPHRQWAAPNEKGENDK